MEYNNANFLYIVLMLIFLFAIILGYITARVRFASNIYNNCNNEEVEFLMDFDCIIWKHLFDWDSDLKHWLEK